jgi:hypothetical protein
MKSSGYGHDNRRVVIQVGLWLVRDKGDSSYLFSRECSTDFRSGFPLLHISVLGLCQQTSLASLLQGAPRVRSSDGQGHGSEQSQVFLEETQFQGRQVEHRALCPGWKHGRGGERREERESAHARKESGVEVR